jgi:N-acetyl sugar amidotransferase
MTEYRICTRCVMDTTDPDITFDENGVCNHCHTYDRMVREYVHEGEAGKRKLEQVVAEIRRAGKGKQYDCVIGVSGGVDSTYVAYLVKKLGLRPLAIHLDNGWDSELAVKNIEETLKRLGIDLYTEVLDWEEFKDLQVAFLKASTPDSEIPSDHAIFATLSNMAAKLGIKYVIVGNNVRTETHLPRAWSQGHFDWKYIREVHKRFGTRPLKTFPHYGFFTFYLRMLTQKQIPILDYVDFTKKEALRVLQEELGWRYYGGKHYESIYTRFYQGYILPEKFGYDKRRCHVSSLICSGEMTREQALEEIKSPTYASAMQEEDREYVVKKLGLTDDEFIAIMSAPKKSYWDYPSYGQFMRQPVVQKTIPMVKKVMGWFK